MIKGRELEKLLRVEDILDRTDGGYDVYMHYLGKTGRQMDRPWGRRERKSSWGVYPHNGVWMWKDQATEETGTCVHFVMKLFGLDFNNARDKIIYDFGLSEKSKLVNLSPVTVHWEKPYDDEGYARFNFTKKPFSERHHEFWNVAGVSEEHCNRKECWAVKDLAIKGRKQFIAKDEIVFAYYCREEDAVKIYFPDRDKSERFKNNVSYHHLWNYENVGECENLIIQKSMKDLIVTTMITPCCIATQAEAVKIFNQDVVNRINSISPSPWVFYGSDWDGVKKCKQITDTNKWKYVNTEKKYLPDVNDTYGIVKMWEEQEKGTGLRKLEEYMKKKKVI